MTDEQRSPDRFQGLSIFPLKSIASRTLSLSANQTKSTPCSRALERHDSKSGERAHLRPSKNRSKRGIGSLVFHWRLFFAAPDNLTSQPLLKQARDCRHFARVVYQFRLVFYCSSSRSRRSSDDSPFFILSVYATTRSLSNTTSTMPRARTSVGHTLHVSVATHFHNSLPSPAWLDRSSPTLSFSRCGKVWATIAQNLIESTAATRTSLISDCWRGPISAWLVDAG
ncbi:hypothetical protein BKA81DRAFT_196981 [Phyllosticta paracitricarpa]